MSLFIDAKIDISATAEKTRNYLDEHFQDYLAYSGTSRFDLSSPKLDPTGVSGTNGVNHAEEKNVINLDAASCVNAIVHTIYNCSNSAQRPYATILYRSYVKDQKDRYIWTSLGYSKTSYYRLKNRAYAEFAQRVEYWKKRDKADIPDLRIFENGTKMARKRD